MQKSTAIQRQQDSIVITDEQIDLIRKTVAKDATPQELQLYFYDCKRRGVHPLDKLIHFTKRGGKYTPIVSIDYMRSQAAESGEYAGNDDAVFRGEPKKQDFAATVTVHRIVKGLLCAFTATARWSEYNPGSNRMYDNMPHTMLAKCAEGLALRKGFPQQLQGLYIREEMEQAGDDTPMRNVTPTQPQPSNVLAIAPAHPVITPDSIRQTAAAKNINIDAKLARQNKPTLELMPQASLVKINDWLTQAPELATEPQETPANGNPVFGEIESAWVKLFNAKCRGFNSRADCFKHLVTTALSYKWVQSASELEGLEDLRDAEAQKYLSILCNLLADLESNPLI